MANSPVSSGWGGVCRRLLKESKLTQQQTADAEMVRLMSEPDATDVSDGSQSSVSIPRSPQTSDDPRPHVFCRFASVIWQTVAACLKPDVYGV